MSFAAAIFDLDGTLIDSMHVWEKIDRIFLERRGIEIPGDYAGAVCTMSFPQAARYTIDRFGLPETEEALMREWHELAIFEYAHCIRLKPYAAEYLRALKECGVKLATATSLSPALSGPVLQNNDIHDLFDAYCSTEEVAHGRGKEFPDIFLLAAQKLGVAPEACIVFEDILPAVRSAKSAGMRVYCVEDDASAGDRAELQKIADACIPDFARAPRP